MMAVDLVAVYTSDLFAWGILPLLIFLARVADKILGTLRLVSVSRGLLHAAPLFGFFEITIWLLATGEILRNLDSPLNFLAYAAGFAAGIFAGMRIEERISLGTVVLRIITNQDISPIREFMRERKYGTTTLNGDGRYGKVQILLSVMPRGAIPEVVGHLRAIHPHAFYSIEDVREARQGVFPDPQHGRLRRFLDFLALRGKEP